MFTTCRFCGDAIYGETLPSGREAWVGDDGWGTVCSQAPKSADFAHQAADLATMVGYVPVPAMDACR